MNCEEQLKDLEQIYQQTIEKLQVNTDRELGHLVRQMESFLSSFKETNKYKRKLQEVQCKLPKGEKNEESEEDEDNCGCGCDE